MTQDVISRIEADIKSNKLIIFMKGTPESPMCGFSAASVQILKSFPYEFKGVDIIANPEIRAALPQYSNWPTFPQIFVNGELVGGCDILHAMRDSGELETLLKQTFEK